MDLVAGTAVGEGTDVIVVPAPAQPAGPEVELLGSHHSDHIFGTEGNDQLVGQGGGDWIEGRGGDDLVMNAWDEYSPAPRRERATTTSTAARARTSSTRPAAPTRCWVGRAPTTSARRAAPPRSMPAPVGTAIELYFSGGSHTITGGAGRDEVSLGVLNSFGRTRGVFDHRDELFRVRHHNGRRTRAELVLGRAGRRCPTTEAVDLPRHQWGRRVVRRRAVHWHRAGAATTSSTGPTPTTCCSAAAATTRTSATAATTVAAVRMVGRAASDRT